MTTAAQYDKTATPTIINKQQKHGKKTFHS
jgi:hypothetical protein